MKGVSNNNISGAYVSHVLSSHNDLAFNVSEFGVVTSLTGDNLLELEARAGVPSRTKFTVSSTNHICDLGSTTRRTNYDGQTIIVCFGSTSNSSAERISRKKRSMAFRTSCRFSIRSSTEFTSRADGASGYLTVGVVTRRALLRRLI